MQKSEQNVYKLARIKAGMTLEKAAPAIGVSETSLKAYERYERVPAFDVVERMIQVYDAMYLAYQHIHICAGSLEIVPEVSVIDLPMATIRLVNKVIAFAEKHRDRDLMQIAEDGVVSDEERPLFDEIVQELDAIVKAAFEVKCANK